jgi:hypothetical protein
VEAVDFTDLSLLGWLERDGAYVLYDDDGYTAAPVLEEGLRTIRCKAEGGYAAAAGEGLRLDASKVIVG